MKNFLFVLLLVHSFTNLYGQLSIPDTVPELFAAQLKRFPQEKIHLHTDKPYYLAGEKAWFRAHIADAAVHVPATVSRYVYVELIDPLDSVIVRLKIRPDSSSYHGYIPIPEELPEGNYELRAYTNFMQNAGEAYFCTKSIRIAQSQARYIHTDTQFEFVSEKKVLAKFRFFRINPQGTITPEIIRVKVNGGKTVALKPDDDGMADITFNLPPDASHRVLLLETVQDKYLYRQYLRVPLPEKDFDVTFYPEGGAMLSGVSGRVVFKAMKSNGQPADLTGMVYDNDGKETVNLKSDHLGMGNFTLQCVPGKSYHAMVTIGGNEPKRFDLPAVQTSGCALAVNWVKNRLYLSVHKPAGATKEDILYVVAHTRGIVHFAAEWEKEREFIQLQKDMFPSGVLHLLLLDAGMNPLSERLVFINNDDQAHVAYRPAQNNYPTRALVENTVSLTDPAGNPLSGSFSVAITDDYVVKTDTTSNILTTLLLASDLRGNIENPSFYFQPGTVSAWALELLMMTQGWRRYDIPKLLKGDFLRPTTYLEIGPEMSGMVKTLLGGKPEEGISVTALSLKGDYFETAITDKDGRFYFHEGELPDSTRIIVQAMPKKGIKRMELVINSDQYPARKLEPPYSEKADPELLAKYVDKAEQKYTFENGMRMVYLSEVTISADRKPLRKSEYYSYADNSLTEDQIEKYTVTDMRGLLMRLPGVMVSSNRISIRGKEDPLLMVDGVIMEIDEIDYINPLDVAQVDVLKNASTTAIFGSRGGNGVIVVFTKQGKVSFKPKPFHIKTILPLGYQTPAEFYAPKYDTAKAKENQNPDLRTTIYWQPNVLADSTGKASFSFYTADAETSYSVIIEGLTNDGKIIRQVGKVERTIRK